MEYRNIINRVLLFGGIIILILVTMIGFFPFDVNGRYSNSDTHRHFSLKQIINQFKQVN